MLTILLIVLIILALGGFGHTGYRQGWYGGSRPVASRGGWGGGLVGIVLILVVLFLLFGGGRSYFGPTAAPVATTGTTPLILAADLVRGGSAESCASWRTTWIRR